MMGVLSTVAAGVGVAGGLVGNLIGADAAGKAGQAQYDSAQKEVLLAQQALQQQIQQRAQGISQAQAQAAMSPEEIKNINGMLTTQLNSLSASMGNVQKMQGQLDAMDPQVKAAGKDFYNLLTGHATQILQPLQEQQQRQRQALMSQLSSQMGPGFMTSSAGIQALTQFDNNAAITLNQAQMQAVQTIGSQYMGMAGMQQQGQYGLGQQQLNAFGQSLATQGQVAGAYASNTALKTNATISAMAANPINNMAVPAAQGAVTNMAPGQFAGQAGVGQAIGNFSSGIAQMGGFMGGQQFGKMFGGGGGGGGYSGNFGASMSGEPNLGVNTSIPMPANPFS